MSDPGYTRIDVRVNVDLASGGRVEADIHLPSVRGLNDSDRAFVLGVLDRLNTLLGPIGEA